LGLVLSVLLEFLLSVLVEVKKVNMAVARLVYIMPMSPLISVGFLIIL
jgi:hypothetical protein